MRPRVARPGEEAVGRVVSLINQKGGVGKTTSAVNIGAAMARAGLDVLLVDMDPQASLTYSMGLDPDSLERTVYHVLRGDAEAADAVVAHSGYFLLPSGLDLAGAEMELSGVPGRELLLREALEPVLASYDCVLVDCPPALNVLALNALAASAEVYIPLQAEYLSLKGMSMLLRTIKLVRDRVNPSLALGGVFATMYDARKTLNKDVADLVKREFGDAMLETRVRDNVALASAASYGRDIFEFDPKSAGARDYEALAGEITGRWLREAKEDA
jgi:chromosome partitioning protein